MSAESHLLRPNDLLIRLLSSQSRIHDAPWQIIKCCSSAPGGTIRLPARRRAAQSRGRSDRRLPASACAVFEQCARAGPPRHQAAGQRQSAFSLLLVCMAYDRRLRGGSYDSQRPSVRKCGGCEDRSSALLHSSSVRSDELNCRSPSLDFRLDCKLATLPYSFTPDYP
jgi:hypothetical protein